MGKGMAVEKLAHFQFGVQPRFQAAKEFEYQLVFENDAGVALLGSRRGRFGGNGLAHDPAQLRQAHGFEVALGAFDAPRTPDHLQESGAKVRAAKGVVENATLRRGGQLEFRDDSLWGVLTQFVRLAAAGKGQRQGIHFRVGVHVIHLQESQPRVGAGRAFQRDVFLDGQKFDRSGFALEPRLRAQVIGQNFLHAEPVFPGQNFMPVLRNLQGRQMDLPVGGGFNLGADELGFEGKPIKRMRPKRQKIRTLANARKL